MKLERQDYIFLGKVAECIERYDDTIQNLKSAIRVSSMISLDELKMLQLAYKRQISRRRSEWKILWSLENEESNNDALHIWRVIRKQDGVVVESSCGSDETMQIDASQATVTDKDDVRACKYLLQQYREQIEINIIHLAQQVIELVDDWLLPNAKDGLIRVFCLCLKGDYYRYLCELGKEKESQLKDQLPSNEVDHQDNRMLPNQTDLGLPNNHVRAKLAYEAATQIALAELEPVNPVRLGLALNYSVFLYETEEEDSEAAKKMAQSAVEQAINYTRHVDNGVQDKLDNTLHTISMEEEARFLLKYLKANLKEWSEKL